MSPYLPLGIINILPSVILLRHFIYFVPFDELNFQAFSVSPCFILLISPQFMQKYDSSFLDKYLWG